MISFIGFIIIAVVLGYLGLLIMMLVRFLQRDRVSPEVKALVQDIKQLVAVTNAEIDKTIEAIDRLTTRYETLKGYSPAIEQSIFIVTEEPVNILIPLQINYQPIKPSLLTFTDIEIDPVVVTIYKNVYRFLETNKPATGIIPSLCCNPAA
jgi:hypothetical protein